MNWKQVVLAASCLLAPATVTFGQCGAGGDCFVTHGPGCNDTD
ncbi:MAG: hypothetical protein SGJ09_00335 [Phycisphaerae bacterium]|nr:hypothetical protein [Phycisphaerae bacterium]